MSSARPDLLRQYAMSMKADVEPVLLRAADSVRDTIAALNAAGNDRDYLGAVHDESMSIRWLVSQHLQLDLWISMVAVAFEQADPRFGPNQLKEVDDATMDDLIGGVTRPLGRHHYDPLQHLSGPQPPGVTPAACAPYGWLQGPDGEWYELAPYDPYLEWRGGAWATSATAEGQGHLGPPVPAYLRAAAATAATAGITSYGTPGTYEDYERLGIDGTFHSHTGGLQGPAEFKSTTDTLPENGPIPRHPVTGGIGDGAVEVLQQSIEIAQVERALTDADRFKYRVVFQESADGQRRAVFMTYRILWLNGHPRVTSRAHGAGADGLFPLDQPSAPKGAPPIITSTND